MKVSIITLDGVQFAGEADSATLPTTSGQITLLNRHAPIVSQLKEGKVLLKGAQKKEFFVGKGVAEFRHSNTLVLLTESCQELEL